MDNYGYTTKELLTDTVIDDMKDRGFDPECDESIEEYTAMVEAAALDAMLEPEGR